MKKTFLFLAVLSLVSCHTTKTTTTTTTTTNTEEAFCIGLLQQSIQKGENAFLSPASAAMALNMLLPGAQGSTLNELKKVVPSMDVQPSDQLQIASALWINHGINIKKSFLRANAQAEVYHGRITSQRVNQWANDRTNGKITQVLQDPLPAMQMALTNAIYFKAEWADPFRANGTKKEPFYGYKSKQVCEMMHQLTHFQYIENGLLQAVRLNYAAPYCMDIYLPQKGKTLEDIIDNIQNLDLDTAESKKVRLGLPKIKLVYEKQLNDYLKNMGLKTCFSNQADFSGISTTPLFIDFVKQNTYLSINEMGTEAAAVTTIGMAKMASKPKREKTYEMVMNRPFIILIRDIRSRQILFYGLIQEMPE